jgi:hypothetical protein
MMNEGKITAAAQFVGRQGIQKDMCEMGFRVFGLKGAAEVKRQVGMTS